MLQEPDVVIPHTIFKCVQSYRVHFQEGGEEVNMEGRAKKIGVILFNIFLHCQAQSGGKRLEINIILALIYAL